MNLVMLRPVHFLHIEAALVYSVTSVCNFLYLFVSISHFKYIGFHFMCMDWVLSWSVKSLGLLLAHLSLPFFSLLL